LLRVLWATADGAAGRRYPAAISGPSPPDRVEIVVAECWAAALHALLSGTSRRLLDELAAGVELEAVEPYLRPALRRDLVGAAAFFRYGPQALRRLRLRHGLPARPLPRAEIESLLAAEVAAITA
jgi:hypothetical protein